MLTHLSLFSGIGCSDLAAEWAGFETVLMCEIDPDCQKVLRKIFPGVPIIEDVRDVTNESVIANSRLFRQAQRQIETVGSVQCNSQSLANTEGGESWEPSKQEGREDFSRGNSQLTLMSAGVPCQPASIAGKRRGKNDDRWLWPEAIRVLSELKPTWAVFENPVGISTLGEYGEIIQVGSEALESLPDNEAVELDRICGDIEKAGYEVQPVSIPACAVEAPHERQRIFIICHAADSESINGWRLSIREESSYSESRKLSGSINPHSQKPGLERTITEGRVCTRRLPAEYDREYWRDNWYDKAIELCTPKTKPGVRTVDDGITTGLLGLSRVTKIKMLGNCNPPQLYYPIYKAIADIENS